MPHSIDRPMEVRVSQLGREKAIALVIEELDLPIARSARIELSQNDRVGQTRSGHVRLREIRSKGTRQAIMKAEPRALSQERKDARTECLFESLEVALRN